MLGVRLASPLSHYLPPPLYTPPMAPPTAKKVSTHPGCNVFVLGAHAAQAAGGKAEQPREAFPSPVIKSYADVTAYYRASSAWATMQGRASVGILAFMLSADKMGGDHDWDLARTVVKDAINNGLDPSRSEDPWVEHFLKHERKLLDLFKVDAKRLAGTNHDESRPEPAPKKRKIGTGAKESRARS
jgi:hypothetical protein